MAKFKLNIEETRILHHYITVEAEDDIDIFDSLVRAGESGKKINIKDCINYLDNDGFKVLDIKIDNDGESILDCDEIERVE